MKKETRLLLLNQYQILSILDEEQREEHLRNFEILSNGFEHQYKELFDNLCDEISSDVTGEVEEILTMYKYINGAISKLTPEQNQTLSETLERIKFEGFDGNHDPHYRYFKYLKASEERSEELQAMSTNSHSQATLGKYRRMLGLYHTIVQDETNCNWGANELTRFTAI